jgi:hypothetical protein
LLQVSDTIMETIAEFELGTIPVGISLAEHAVRVACI